MSVHKEDWQIFLFGVIVGGAIILGGFAFLFFLLNVQVR